MEPRMSRLLTTKYTSITEMREPSKVLSESGNRPIAVMQNSQCIGYFVPAEIVDQNSLQPISKEKLIASLTETQETAAPVLNYLKDK